MARSVWKGPFVEGSLIKKAEKPGEWNTYEIRAEDQRRAFLQEAGAPISDALRAHAPAEQ